MFSCIRTSNAQFIIDELYRDAAVGSAIRLCYVDMDDNHQLHFENVPQITNKKFDIYSNASCRCCYRS